jgi:hypothetical protein
MPSPCVIARRMTATACTAAVFLCLPAFADAQPNPPAPAQVPMRKAIDQAELEIAPSLIVKAARPVHTDNIVIAASRRIGGRFL